MVKLAINGFGRIGRLFFRQVAGKPDFQVVAVNDLGSRENLEYLLRYDTVYGKFDTGLEDIRFSQEKDPAKLPWKELGVDIVVESTGAFESFEAASLHLKAGARRVVLSAPAKDEDTETARTVLVGVNDKAVSGCPITSNASCTTNSVASVIEILRENPGVKKAVLNTVHAYTATQNLVDGPVKGSDIKRGRAAAANIVPATTGAASALTRAIPELEAKFDGIALRVPVQVGSLADITFVAARPTSVEEINNILKSASESSRWKGIVKVTRDPIVSSDIIGEPFGAIVDLSCTLVIDRDLVKVLSWYDNEWGYAATLVKHIELVAKAL